MVEIPHTEIVSMMRDLATIKVDMEKAHEERANVQGDLREIKGVLAEMRVTLATVSSISEALTTMRSSSHDRFNDVHKMFGSLDQRVIYQHADIKDLKEWRHKLVLSRAINQVWISWLTAAFASAGTVLFVEIVKWVFRAKE